MALTREAVVAEALSWVGTPYVHQARTKGAGTDCLGLVLGVWQALIGALPQEPPPYVPDWDLEGPESLLEAARAFLVARAERLPGQRSPADGLPFLPGDVLLFRMRPGAAVRHCAIALPNNAMVHAYWGRAVVVSHLGPWWRVRLAGAFGWPGID